MEDSFQVTCPYCGETVELFLESDVEGSLVQDCEVCCNPWQVQVWTEEAIAGYRWDARMGRNN